MNSIREYLREIGRRGGTRSRRALSSGAARDMVRVREARRAYRRFRASCFWSYRADLRIGIADVPWVAEQLMRLGDREAWRVGARLVAGAEERRWADSWRRAAGALEAHRAQEAARLTTPPALADLAAAFDHALRSAAPRSESGLVEQQRWFRLVAAR